MRMKRRSFLKAAGAAAIATAAPSAIDAQEEDTMEEAKTASLAPPCGLYCGICIDYLNGECHGCACACNKCAGKWHDEHCLIARCAHSKQVESCAQCEDLPCTRLIQFTVDPVWRTHAPCIENLRRRKKIGTEAWLREQTAHWQDEGNRKAWISLYQECSRKWQE
jgi:hypothetical protein